MKDHLLILLSVAPQTKTIPAMTNRGNKSFLGRYPEEIWEQQVYEIL